MQSIPMESTTSFFILTTQNINDSDNSGIDDGDTVALWQNQSTTGDANDIVNSPVYDADALNNNGGVVFSNGGYNIPNSSSLNTSGITQQYSIGIVFEVSDKSGTQTVYEQGGATRGYGVQLVNGRLYFGAWNNAEWAEGERYKFVDMGEIEENKTYYLALVHESTDDFTGTHKIYNNGTLAGTLDKVGQQRAHSGRIGLGQVDNHTVYPESTRYTQNSGNNFKGTIGELVIWQDALQTSEVNALNTYFANRWNIAADPIVESFSEVTSKGTNLNTGDTFQVTATFNEDATLTNGATVFGGFYC